MHSLKSSANVLYSSVSKWNSSKKIAVGAVGVAAWYAAYNYLSSPKFNDGVYQINDELISNLKYVGKHPSQIPLKDFKNVVNEMKLCFKSNITRKVSNRKKELKKLIKLLKENREQLVLALKEDLGRPELIGYATTSASKTKGLLKNIDKWVAPQNLGFDIKTFPSSNYILHEPYGTVYINGIWNFPISLAINQIGGAICAGNNVVVKTCNAAPRCSKLLCDLLHKYMDPRFVQVLGYPSIANGDDRVITDKILENEFDLIFFTGSSNGGKYILEKASKFLTPCILELGGKNPIIIDDSADIAAAARNIMSYRVLNCGQVCLAPDYVLIYQNVVDRFIEECKKCAIKWYRFGDDITQDLGVCQSKFISKTQYARCVDLLNKTKGDIVLGGGHNEEQLMMEPTCVLLDNIKNISNEPTIEIETFGPILWIVPINNDIQEAVDYINTKPKSLTMSLYSKNKKHQNIVKYNTSSGGLQINGHINYLQHEKAPFGGVGNSGMGSYHGIYSFEAFSHKKPVGISYAEQNIAYPPYSGRFKEWLFKKIL